ncbi:hypothetical protein FRZ44_33530 [Hypericibacter terrae]|uniref:Uncharacterized protein n=1 Tax=Hypericibacter terrae TaxID=2602015 RepID=A0A5J6ML20_9PROT|nr:hypothetical protein [Hypericibacter terrae]QEX18049.1 hypothetical protein FRZ44_33530 [Hypericibacter terrae]
MSNDLEIQNSNSSDDSGQIVPLAGGVYRYQVGARQPEQSEQSQSGGASGKWVGDVQRTTVRDGQMRHETVANVTKSTDAPAQGSHWLDNARTTSGRPLSRSEIDENSIVTVPGAGQFQVKTLLRTGDLIKTPDGRIVEPPKNAFDQFDKQQQQQQPAAPNAEAGETLDADGEALAQTIINGTREGDRMAAMRQLIDGNGITAATLEHIASSMHIEPDKAAGMVESLVGKFSEQAAKAVSQVAPVDLQDVAEWARANKPNDLKKAMWAIASDDKGAGFRSLTQEYIAALPTHAPHMILNAEMPEGVTAVEHNGRVILKTPYGDFDWASAVKSGFVTVSRRGRR